MAVFGAQLVMTLIMVSIIQKLGPYFSFAKCLLCCTGLKRYLQPSNAHLKSLAGIPKDKTRNKSREKSSSFHVPRNIDIQLEVIDVSENDVVHLRYFSEFQWLFDFSAYAGLIYIFSEIYRFYYPGKGEVDLSVVWCLLVVFFAIKLLASLTILYFKSEESIGERSMCIVACFVYLLVAMIVLVIDEQILETGLENAFQKFNQSASTFLAEQKVLSSGPASKIVIKFFIAVFCGLQGSLFTFPGLRMAKMHWDSLRYCQERKLLKILLNISFVLPFILVILWIKPISRDYLTERMFGGMESPLMSPHAFETARLFAVITVVCLRLALLPIYLQSYLNLAYERIELLKKEGGRITNTELKQKVSSIFYYLCVVTLQFAAPLMVCMYLTLMYKNLGGLSWRIFGDSTADYNNTDNHSSFQDVNPLDYDEEKLDNNFLHSVHDLQTSWGQLKKVFSAEVYKGFLGFATWWSYFLLFATSALGLLYQSYFTKT